MTSLRQIESNRRNAQKSTGPTTPEGKRRSSQNAVRHGLTAETVAGPLEDAADYKGFELAVTASYDAQTAVERELVLRLASLLWRLRRATSVETGLLQMQWDHCVEADRIPPDFVDDVRDVIVAPQSEDDRRSQNIARCFVRLAGLDNGIFERFGRYEAALWRQARQTILTLQQLQWRTQSRRYRRMPDRWQGTTGQ